MPTTRAAWPPPDWIFYDGVQMFVVDITPAGFPIGLAEEDDPGWIGGGDGKGRSTSGT